MGEVDPHEKGLAGLGLPFDVVDGAAGDVIVSIRFIVSGPVSLLGVMALNLLTLWNAETILEHGLAGTLHRSPHERDRVC
jgi:hypothetical protein